MTVLIKATSNTLPKLERDISKTNLCTIILVLNFIAYGTDNSSDSEDAWLRINKLFRYKTSDNLKYIEI